MVYSDQTSGLLKGFLPTIKTTEPKIYIIFKKMVLQPLKKGTFEKKGHQTFIFYEKRYPHKHIFKRGTFFSEKVVFDSYKSPWESLYMEERTHNASALGAIHILRNTLHGLTI